MSEKVEKYIKDYTRNCSNFSELRSNDGFVIWSEHKPWLTPDHARRVADIAREEVIEKATEWFKNYFEGTVGGMIQVEDFRKAMMED